MTVNVRLFAILKERAGTDQVELDLPESATVADAIAALSCLPGLSGLSEGSARMAVNREYATRETPLRASDELALIPPVSGGDPDAHLVQESATVQVSVSARPLALDALLAFVASEHAGAVVNFQGLPRDIPSLDYEAYGEMAVEKITAILTQVIDAHGLCAAAAAHRIGSVPALEPSILIAVSAPHRGEAFAGAREALDRIKFEAPIWKVEVAADGERRRPEGVLPS